MEEIKTSIFLLSQNLSPPSCRKQLQNLLVRGLNVLEK